MSLSVLWLPDSSGGANPAAVPEAGRVPTRKPAALPLRDPASVGLDPEKLAVADRLVEHAVKEDGVPGAVLLIARNGGVALRKAYGHAALRPDKRPMREDTIFDVASLTKTVATATAMARLLEDGRVELDAPVARYLPAYAAAGGDKALITVRHLMTHAAGLPAGGAYAGKKRTVPQILEEIAASRQKFAPGEGFLYSDFTFVSLGGIVEAVSGQTLDAFCRDNVFSPLGMTDTGYVPGPEQAARCASTSSGDDKPELRGKVHDPTALALGGVSGNAGLFSTVDDLARFSQMMLNGGELDGVRILKPETVKLVTTKQSPFEGNDRGLGWDIASGYALRGSLSEGSYGHSGFTGTSMWIDPTTRTFIILLSNAVHAQPSAGGVVIPMRRQVSSAVAEAILPAKAP